MATWIELTAGSIHNRAEFLLSFSIGGELIEVITQEDIPSVAIKPGGATLSYEGYYFAKTLFAEPDEAEWAYIWAGPIIRIWEVEVCTYGLCTTLDGIDAFVSDVLTRRVGFDGVVERGLPHESIMRNLFNATSPRRLVIQATSLDDGKLDVGKGVANRQISLHYDECGVLGIGVPVGAVLSPGACTALGLDPASQQSTALVAILSAFCVIAEARGDWAFIGGGIQDGGSDCSNCADVSEVIYVCESVLQYETRGSWRGL